MSHVSEWPLSKKSTNKCWSWCGEKETLLDRCWECKLVQPLWRTEWKFLKKLKIGLPCDPVVPLLDMYLGKTVTGKDASTLMFFAALFTIAGIGKQPK